MEKNCEFYVLKKQMNYFQLKKERVNAQVS